MDQETWKFVLDYLSAKENAKGNDQKFEHKEKKIQEWLSKDPKNRQDLEQALWLWEHTSAPLENEEWKAGFNAVKTALLTEPPRKTAKFKVWMAAAAIFAAIVMFTFFYKVQQPVSTHAEISWITKSARPGKMINIMLPDSTEILLNSGSSISFPENLKHAGLRTVKLKGEAFFKVKRDPRHPFVVYSLNIQTRVLGTSFNIRAWEGHRAEVTVLTGKVAVSRDSAGMQSAAIHLLPNQKAVCDLNLSKLYRQNIEDAHTAIDWTEGKMVFDQMAVPEIFEAIERKFAVKVIADQSFKDCKLTAKFNNISLNDVLQTIQATLNIQYTINKNTVYIKGGKCN